MYAEDELLPVSALQHLVFCERQCALIHVERLWIENALTLEGSHRHRRVDGGGPSREQVGDLLIVRGLPIWSRVLGLTGRADVVEFHGIHHGQAVPDRPFSRREVRAARVLPVEYKRGRPKKDKSDEVQLCAQALCLEEMLGLPVEDGALFYGRTQRRTTISFKSSLRDVTKQTVRRLHALFRAKETPRAGPVQKCQKCSLRPICLPSSMKPGCSATEYLQRMIAESDL